MRYQYDPLLSYTKLWCKVVPRFLMNGTMATFMGNAIEQFGIRGQMEET